jgi:hypothetical protein
MALSKAIAAESKITGKCLEDLLAKKDPKRYHDLCVRMIRQQLRQYLNTVEAREYRRSIECRPRTAKDLKALDALNHRLAMKIGEVIRLDEEYERKWDAIKTNLRCAGAHSE